MKKTSKLGERRARERLAIVEAISSENTPPPPWIHTAWRERGYRFSLKTAGATTLRLRAY